MSVPAYIVIGVGVRMLKFKKPGVSLSRFSAFEKSPKLGRVVEDELLLDKRELMTI